MATRTSATVPSPRPSASSGRSGFASALIFDAEAALFSAKCCGAALLAYYVALRIGLERPFWAVTTVYVTAQPLAGAVLAKSIYRVVGTMLGATAAVVLVPHLVDEPAVLSLALALWLAICTYLSALDRTPRAYILLLAGYTASIIGFPSVDAPQTIFDTAIVRVQEIVLGIVCTSLCHGLLFPRTVTARLVERVGTILTEVRGWSQAALSGGQEREGDLHRRGIATELAELTTLGAQLPFDTARLVPRIRIVRALQNRLTGALPLAIAVEDRIAALDANGGVPDRIEALLARCRDWFDDRPTEQRHRQATVLLEDIRATAKDAGEPPSWRAMLVANLLSRLAELIEAIDDAHILGAQIASRDAAPASAEVRRLTAWPPARSVARDRPHALRTAIGAFVTILLGCLFWIATSWPSGANAVLIMGVGCALFGGTPNPRGATIVFTLGAIAGILLSALYAYAIVPRVTDPVLFALVLTPALLLLGCVLGRASMLLPGLGMAIGFCNTIGLTQAYQPDFAGFANGALSLVLGIAFVAAMLGIFQTLGTTRIVARMRRAGFRDVARRARGQARDTDIWAARMLDRVALLSAGSGSTTAPECQMLDALVDLRIGIVAGDLAALRRSLPPEEHGPVGATLDEIARFFGSADPRTADTPPPALLERIDRSVGAFARDPERERRRAGLLLLTSLRRNLFPSAPPWQAEGAAA